MNGKLIFILLSQIWVTVEDLKGKIEYLVHEIWPRTYGWIDFKFYKKQMKSENHEICHDTMISYVESVIKNWEGFAKVLTYIAYEMRHLRRSSIDNRGFIKILSNNDDRIGVWIQNFLYRQ